jgi:hypothetical protein
MRAQAVGARFEALGVVPSSRPGDGCECPLRGHWPEWLNPRNGRYNAVIVGRWGNDGFFQQQTLPWTHPNVEVWSKAAVRDRPRLMPVVRRPVPQKAQYVKSRTCPSNGRIPDTTAVPQQRARQNVSPETEQIAGALGNGPRHNVPPAPRALSPSRPVRSPAEPHLTGAGVRMPCGLPSRAIELHAIGPGRPCPHRLRAKSSLAVPLSDRSQRHSLTQSISRRPSMATGNIAGRP